MNNESPVCECGCPLTRHVRFINGVLACAAGCPRSCEQFTDARLAELRAEIADLKQTLSDTQRFADLNLHNWMARLPQLEAEIARLKLTATRELPEDGDSNA